MRIDEDLDLRIAHPRHQEKDACAMTSQVVEF